VVAPLVHSTRDGPPHTIQPARQTRHVAQLHERSLPAATLPGRRPASRASPSACHRWAG
jgi:hypothetical protein